MVKNLFVKCQCVQNLKIIAYIIGFFTLTTIFHPLRHAKHYYYIPVEDTYSELVNNNNSTNFKPCSYEHLIFGNEEIAVNDIFQNYNQVTAEISGGEYMPILCKSAFKTAVIIPYRNRKDQLDIFLNYIHYFLQRQNIHYRIFVIEQNNTLEFNRAKLFNIGAIAANQFGYPCLILHDVDLIPITTGNIYACSKRPRHMCSSLDTFRFNLPYEGLFGGAISILTEQFQTVNGMSNLFVGWGGEDDDLYERLKTHNIIPYRFAPNLSKYIMLKHKKAKPSGDRFELLQSGSKRQQSDGLNSLPPFIANHSIVIKRLYTLIVAT